MSIRVGHHEVEREREMFADTHKVYLKMTTLNTTHQILVDTWCFYYYQTMAIHSQFDLDSPGRGGGGGGHLFPSYDERKADMERV